VEVDQLHEPEVRHRWQGEQLRIVERITGTEQSGRLREEGAASTSAKKDGIEWWLRLGWATTDTAEQQTKVLNLLHLHLDAT
jgi:hypothetical protein